jgi:tRNA A37 methylthiotransferase MiaB
MDKILSSMPQKIPSRIQIKKMQSLRHGIEKETPKQKPHKLKQIIRKGKFMIIKEIYAKSILSESKVLNYTINSYIGCEHGCTYCYARFIKRNKKFLKFL